MTDAQATQQAIERLAEADQETGLQVAAYLHGELVVSACAGLADPASGRPIDARTLFNSSSAGKGLTSTVAHVLAEQRLPDYDTPIAWYWPQFGTHGQQQITVAHVLSRRAGVPQAPAGITPPSWPTGTRCAAGSPTCGRCGRRDARWRPSPAAGTASSCRWPT
jgi:CubicO group peptidase (beta-lactamase class C family)